MIRLATLVSLRTLHLAITCNCKPKTSLRHLRSPEAPDNTGISASSLTAASAATTGVSNLSVGTYSAAQVAIALVDDALATVNSTRSTLGATQSRFESAVRSQMTTAENLSASRSRIQDADFAAETANLAKAQILQQSGIAMLAQANAIPQNVLALLQ